MKAIILKQNLQEGINIVQRAVVAKSTLHVLEGIYIEAGETFKLIGNCIDLGIEYTVEADIKETGSVVINSRIFGDIIRKLPDAPVSIEVSDDFKVRIECLNSIFEIRGMDASIYPLLPEINEELSFNITQAMLKELIKQTIFAVGDDENRKIMTGVLLEADNGEIVVVALDGYRMAVAQSIIKEDVKFRVVIPGRNMNEILRILETTEEPVKVSLSGNLVSFVLNNCRIISNVLNCEFMNYKSYIPSQYESVILIDTKEFIESLERAILLTSDDKRYPVKLNITDDELILHTATDIGISKENIRIENQGANMLVGFNPHYLIDALKVINDEKIKISFNSSIGPCVITPLDHNRYLFLILPVRIRNNQMGPI
jgi:DNA polymerase-3 subunit beta